jgi:hypothetical protein
MGVGGGILFVPALVLFLGEGQLEAEATSLLAIVPVSIVGAWRQRSYGNVRVKPALLIGLLSPLGVLVGTLAANALAERPLQIVFACLVLLVAAQLAHRALRQAPAEP